MHGIGSLATEDPGGALTLADTRDFLSSLLPQAQAERFERLLGATRIRRRQSLAPYDVLRGLRTIEERNALYLAHAPKVGEAVAVRALADADLNADEIDVLVVASSTGFAIPTLDQHLAQRLALRPQVRSVYLGGLGCAGALRGVSLAKDLLPTVSPAGHALVVSVELCSPWLQVAEPSPEDILSNITFGDGAGATIVGASQDRRDWLEVVAHGSVCWPDSLDARGATLGESGFRHYATPTLPRILRRHLGSTVGGFLAQHGVAKQDLAFYAVNPSDHRVLETIGHILDVSDEQMRPAWDVWENHGNTLSAGPLYVLDAVRRLTLPGPEQLGLALVLGPGLTCDLMLLKARGRLP